MLKEAVCVAKGRLEWRMVEEKATQGDEVKIRSRFGAAKHGTEMAIYRGEVENRGVFDPKTGLFDRSRKANPYPWPLGNMIVGEVIETGPDVQTLAEGDRVLCYGGFKALHIRSEQRCWKLPAEMPWQSAVCLDPADFAFSAIRDGQVRIGDAVAVFGLGAIALIAIQLLRLAGAGPIIAVDPLANRREVAASLGADLVLDPRDCDAGLEIRNATAGRGVDVSIEYSGSAQALQHAIRGVAYGGNVVFGAFPPPFPAGLDFGAESHHNVPNLIFSRACSEPLRDHPRWDEQRIYRTCFDMLADGRLDGRQIVTPVAPFEQILKAYEAIAADPASNIKLGVEF